MKKIFLSLVTLLSFIFNEVPAESTKSKVEETMTEKISILGHGNSFTYVDLDLTDQELYLIDKVKFDNLDSVNGQKEYNRFGDLHLLKEELPSFLRNIGNDDEEVIQAVTEIIDRATQQVTKAANKNSAWVAVRAFTPTHEYDIPRWHIDGPFYGLNGPYPYPGTVFKFAAVLKGRPTLLYKLPNDMRAMFCSNQNDRIFLSKLLDLNKAESPKKGEGVFFIVGNDDIGAVHSEPKMDESRLFFSILIGDESEINELYLRWHPEKN